MVKTGIGLIVVGIIFTVFQKDWALVVGGLFFLGGIVCIVIAIIKGIVGFFTSRSSGGYSSGGSYSSTSSNMAAWAASRDNDPHTCANCTKYSSTKGECRITGNSTTEGDSCSSWC